MATHHGIRTRHSRGCPTTTGGTCNADAKNGCSPSYEAWTWSKRENKKIRQSFPTLAAAKSWRDDAKVAVRKGTMRSPSQVTVREAANAWLEGAKTGAIRTRSGDQYKPSAIRSYESSLNQRILEDYGALRLSELTRTDLQDLADKLLAEGLNASTIRNVLMPVRAIYRRAMSRGEVSVNPTTGLELAAVRGKRDRIASPTEAVSLIAAAPEQDRALWATALYSGLRRGELLALRWDDVDLKENVIRVERAWDDREGIIEPKSAAGRRTVPIASSLRAILMAHRLRVGRFSGLVLGVSADTTFKYTSVLLRAKNAWTKANVQPIGLHECRHTFASLMIAAGVNAKALSTYLGHSSVTITYDRYGHLMPGNEREAATLLDTYLSTAIAAESS